MWVGKQSKPVRNYNRKHNYDGNNFHKKIAPGIVKKIIIIFKESFFIFYLKLF